MIRTFSFSKASLTGLVALWTGTTGLDSLESAIAKVILGMKQDVSSGAKSITRAAYLSATDGNKKAKQQRNSNWVNKSRSRSGTALGSGKLLPDEGGRKN